jgi:hypothetical protein
MAEKRLFRQAALDRLASPEQLDRLVTVADGGGWLALALFATLAACVLAWSLTGSLSRTMRTHGILVAAAPAAGQGEQPRLAAVLFLPAQAGKPIASGMAVRIAPRGFRAEAYGALAGSIESISEFPLAGAALAAAVPGADPAALTDARGPVYAVRVALAPDARGSSLRATSGTLVDADITLSRQRPVELLLPLLPEKSGPGR